LIVVFLEKIFLACALWLVQVLPYPIFRVKTIILTRLMFFMSRRLRRAALESLRIAFGTALSPIEEKKIIRRSFETLFLGLADMIYASGHPDFARKMFVLEGREYLDEALKKGKGAALAVAHFGPFAAMLFKLIAEGYKVSVILRPLKLEGVYQALPVHGKRCGLNMIYSVPVRTCLVEGLRALERGEIVVMPVDQNYGATGRLFVDFFGRKAATAPGPVLYGLKNGTPVLTAFAVPGVKPGQWVMRISSEVPMERGASEKESLMLNTQALTREVETMVRQYPECWSWMHRRWKAVPKQGEI
jgi:KDO2-lipid IV(A) lauroyltransferase